MIEKLDNLYKMLYSSDLDTQLLAVSIIKEDPEFNWIYLEALDEKNFLKKYSIDYFYFFGLYNLDIILLHRVRFIFYEFYIKNNDRFN